MHHYLYFVSVMFADHSATYAEKWSNRPHLAFCGSYHVGNENEELQSSQYASRPVYIEDLCACTKKTKKKKKQLASYSWLSPATGESRL